MPNRLGPRGDRLIVMAGSHVVLGVAAWTWAAPHLGMPVLDPLAVAVCAIGALLPDIDHPSSWVGRRLRVISRPLAATIGHRGITHSLVAVVACLVFKSRVLVVRVPDIVIHAKSPSTFRSLT